MLVCISFYSRLFFSKSSGAHQDLHLSLHDALPISQKVFISYRREETSAHAGRLYDAMAAQLVEHNVFMDVELAPDRKSTRLNSSHQIISYAVFCLKKKKKIQ